MRGVRCCRFFVAAVVSVCCCSLPGTRMKQDNELWSSSYSVSLDSTNCGLLSTLYRWTEYLYRYHLSCVPESCCRLFFFSDTNGAKIIWFFFFLKITKSLLLFDKKCCLGTYKRCKNYLKLSESNRKTERKAARLHFVCSTNSQIQPNTRTVQCAWCLFMFLLVLLSHNQIIFQIKHKKML